MNRVISACGVPIPPDATLLPIIQRLDGNAREIVSAAVYVANQAKVKAS